MVGTRILTVEDDERIRTAVKLALEDEGWTVEETGSGEEALEAFNRDAADVVLIDIMLPGMDGFELCRSLRRLSDVPVVMVTARADTHDVVAGLEAGADDYLTKPFDLRELVMRLRALDRRRPRARPPVSEIAGLRLDPFRREVVRDGRYVALTRKQFAVLEVLVAAQGGVVSAEELLGRAWDENANPFTNAVRITVSALRKRLGEPWLIATVPGVGYRIDSASGGGRAGGHRG